MEVLQRPWIREKNHRHQEQENLDNKTALIPIMVLDVAISFYKPQFVNASYLVKATQKQ